ncbi:hypothetical protein NP493_82g04046 [Ridgeia piscesae]|uniref:CMP/dCMP-type deaminase domain-containing protein n=1 Tax=Ridgeia piscesae TaxID=27915 RepID=A0AAD9P8Y6_RIDPI|nr:hypothetical protein NP493_82g04046 [Ridgeia piscesae]
MVLICPLSEVTSSVTPTLTELFNKRGVSAPPGLGEPGVQSVARDPPVTRQQYNVAAQHWPTFFHEDKQITKLLEGEVFSQLDTEHIVHFMQKAQDTAMAARNRKEVAVGAVIVDPASSEVVAVSHDRQSCHPLQHAVMTCIDQVAHSQGAGAWQCQGRCAMALVHSRIRRVFYVTPTQGGALGTHCKLHVQEGLNHHYEVFQMTTSDSSNTLCGACSNHSWTHDTGRNKIT